MVDPRSFWSTCFTHTGGLVITLCESYDILTNYHACIAMPTCCRCVPAILGWPWPLFFLYPRSCLTWMIFFTNFTDGFHFVCITLQMLCIFNKLYFQQIVCTSVHDIDVYFLFMCTNMLGLELWARDIPVSTGACYLPRRRRPGTGELLGTFRSRRTSVVRIKIIYRCPWRRDNI